MSKPIGEINGIFAWLFKITQVIIPTLALTIIPWSVWVTNTLYIREARIQRLENFMSAGPRFTSENAEALRLKIHSEIDAKLAAHNNDVIRRLDALNMVVQEIKLELTRHMAQKP